MFPRNKLFSHQFVPFNEMQSDTAPNGVRFYTTPSGIKYPSVTTVLKHRSAPAIAKWKARVGDIEAAKVSARASSRGAFIHEMCEHYLRNESHKLNEEKYGFQQVTFGQMKPLLNNIDNIHAIEVPLYSHTLKLAGRTDCIAEYNGVLSIIDFKTSLKLKKKQWIDDYFIQETAYAIMYEEMFGVKIKQIVTLISTDAGEAQEFIEYTDNYKEDLIQTLDNYYKLEEAKCF